MLLIHVANRRWLARGVGGVALAACVALGFALRRAPAPSTLPDDPPLKVITFNAQFLPGVGRLFNRRPNAEYRARALAARLADFDIIAVNEVFDAHPRDLLLAGLRQRLGED